ncbi:MAG TPA: right-handed parallel beta-helix repeat-containing protein, partial [Propionibacteriaceae bacterium]|nr:right-handed parallel beta-helix repeat-containing protein [Propionibacteriaceae bacterium]
MYAVMSTLLGMLVALLTTTAAHAQAGATVPTLEEFHALEERVRALEQAGPGPTPPPDGGYVDSGPVTATTGQTIRKIRITNASGGCIKVDGVTDVHIEDVILDGCGGHGVKVTNAHRVKIVNSQITPKRTKTTLETEHAVYIVGSTEVLVQGNVLKDFESGVEVAQSTSSHSIRVVGNYGENPKGPFPRGQFTQFYPCNKNGQIETRCEVTDNHFFTQEDDHHQGSGMEDALNTGSGSKHVYYARNYIEGGGASSGCGLLVEGQGTDYALLEDNILVSTAGCGVNIANSAYAVVRRNKALGPFETVASDSAQLGIGNWYKSGDTGCHDNEVYENTVANKLSTGSYNDIWMKGGCGTQTNNTKGSTAEAQLTPKEQKIPPPSARGVAPLPWTGAGADEVRRLRARGDALAAEVERALRDGKKRSRAERR